MNLNEIKYEIHENAVKHGWWDGDRPRDEVVALIHSEWSEALEAYRNGEGIYYEDEGNNNKPEGIGVELIDGCIRLLDAAAAWKYEVWDGSTEWTDKIKAKWAGGSLPTIICKLHRLTTLLNLTECDKLQGEEIDKEGIGRMSSDCADMIVMDQILGIVWAWVKAQGFDPDSILMAKREYNKTRPYKHGGKVI